MSDAAALRSAFLEAGTAAPELRDAPGLGERLVAAHAAGAAAWPEVALAGVEYARHLARHLPAQASLAELDAWQHTELYLACACGRGDPRALAAFERTFVARVPHFTARVRLSDDARLELVAHLRARLLAPREAGKAPRVADYTGRGSLEGWVRAAAIRLALDLAAGEARNREVGAEDDLAIAPSDDPEVRLLRQRYQREFQQAFEAAIGRLADDDRAVLRFYFVDHLRVDVIGRMLGIDKSNVSRRLARARARVLEGTREDLEQRLGLQGSAFQHVVSAVRSELRLSMTRLLGGGATAD